MTNDKLGRFLLQMQTGVKREVTHVGAWRDFTRERFTVAMSRARD